MDEANISKIDLATVTKTVAETDRRRAMVEAKLSQAQSVVEALNAESKSLQESVLELKRELEETAKAKDEETAELSRTLDERKNAIEELKALTLATDELRTVSEQKSATIGTNLDAAQRELSALETAVVKTSDEAKALDDMATRLRDTVVEARRQADALETQLAAIAQTTKTAVDEAAEVKHQIAAVRAGLDIAATRKRETDETCAALAAITSALRSKTSDAIVAVKNVDDMIVEQSKQSSTLANRLAAVAKLVGQPEREHKNGARASIVPSGNGVHAVDSPARFGDAMRAIALLTLERQIAPEEGDRITTALQSGDGERALREAWALTTTAAMPSAHRLIFGEVLRAMGDVKAAVVYFEQAASAKNAPPVIRYLAAVAYMRMDLLDRSTYVAQLLARDRGGKLLNRIVEALRTEQSGNADYAAHTLAETATMRGFPKWEYDEAYFQLGALHERRNDIDAAVAAYEKVSASGPYAAVVDRVRALF